MSKGGGSKTVTSTSDISSRFQPFVNENLALAGTIANMPFQPFRDGDPSAALANFSNDQLAAFDQVRGMNARVNPALDAADATTAAAIQGITDPSRVMELYTNPYQDDVIDPAVDRLRQERDAMNETARLKSPFGGTRQALTESANNRNFLEAVGALEANERSKAFSQAAGLGQNAVAQLLGAGSQLGNMAANRQNIGLTGASAQSGIGQQIQGLDQAYKDYMQQTFYDAMNHPLRQLGIRMGAVGMTPMGTVQRTPIMRQSNIGGLLSGAGGLMQGIAALCWVAREVYGATNPKWLKMRKYMIEKAPKKLFDKYATYGEAIAKNIAHDEVKKRTFREAMDKILAGE